jgi:SAM-dependent methyltransferase
MEVMCTDQQYWCDTELELPTGCVACGGVVLEVIHTGLKDYEEGVPGIWSMLRCEACNSLSLSPRPTRAAVFKAYRSYYTHQSPVDENRAYEGTSLAWRLTGGYLRHRFGVKSRKPLSIGNPIVRFLLPLRLQLDYLYRHLPLGPGRLLDIGCGNGAFLLRAQTAGWDVEGVEPDAVAASQARAHGLAVFVGDIADFVPVDRYDVITLAHVIEHLHDPSTMLRACVDLLRPSGTLWIATPNIESIGHRLFSAAWQPLETPRHLVMPSPRALAAMLRDTGFVDIRFVRRGRGSRKRFDASNRRTSSYGLPMRSALFWSTVVDLHASCNTCGAEEIVVMARLPGGAT